jgi:hypothetical protein
MQVIVITARTTVKDGQGREVEGLTLTCSRCSKRVEVYGTSGASIRRGYVKLRDGCEEKGNFYVEKELRPKAHAARSSLFRGDGVV